MDERGRLMRETLEQAEEYIPKLIVGINVIANELRTGMENETAASMLNDAIDGLEWINDAVNLTIDFWVNKDVIEADALKDPLAMMAEAMQNRDHILLADVLDYEIKPVLENWLKTINDAL